MSIINSANLFVARKSRSQYQIERSLRFNSADSAYLNRTYSGACQDAKLMTISVWVKRGRLTTSGQQPIFSSYSAVRFGGDLTWTTADKIQFRPGGNGDGASNQYSISTDAVFRDPSAWYHIVIQYDSTQATSTNRQKIYVNGVQQTVTGNYPTQNYLHTYAFNNANNQIGAYTSYGSDYLDSYLTESHFIDGQALTPSSFGETDTITGVWKPKRYSGTYGTNGFYLKFADNSGTTSTTLGKDSSGNGNNWTPNNFSVTAGAGNDSLIDTPTPYADGGNGRGNYCTLNPLDSTATLSNGNLTQTATAERSSRSTFQIPSSGLWYAEATATSTTNGSTISCGFGLAAASVSLTANPYNLASAWNLYSSNFAFINRNGTPSSSLGFTLTAGDVVQIAVDPANNRAWIGRNNTWYNSTTGTTGDPAGGANPTVSSLPAGLFVFANTFNQTWDVNFGQRAFAYTPPSGFLALNTQNLPEPSIKKPGAHFNTVLYNNATVVTGVGFAPDLIWHKSRNQTYNHYLYDRVRGTGAKGLNSNTTSVEGANDVLGIVSFDSNGFTWSSDAGLSQTNAVAWCWDESATPGFDIVTYTGDGVSNRTVSHALGVVPAMIIIKDRDTNSNANNWYVWHQSLSSGYNIQLEKTDPAYAVSSSSGGGIGTSPSSSTFTLLNGSSSNVNTNENGDRFVAYLWSEVAGFSKFGSYTGNGSSDGPFVFCGFRPRWVMIKRTDSTANWQIYDTARDTTNKMFLELVPNSSAEENSVSLNIGVAIDALSNGFKLRDSDTAGNASGGTYIFAAFAESPFKYSLAR